MKLNHMYPHWSTNSRAVRQTQPCANHDLRWFQPTNTEFRDTDRCSRQHQAITGSSTQFPSRHMHCFGWLLGYFSPNTLQLLQQQPRPGPPVLYPPKNTLLTPKGEEKHNQKHWHLPSKTAALKISSSPYWSASKARKCMFCSWGLGFPVDNIRGSEVKGRPGSIFQKHRS